VQRSNVSPVRYELGFYIPENDILHIHRRENLKSSIDTAGSTPPVYIPPAHHAAAIPPTQQTNACLLKSMSTFYWGSWRNCANLLINDIEYVYTNFWAVVSVIRNLSRSLELNHPDVSSFIRHCYAILVCAAIPRRFVVCVAKGHVKAILQSKPLVISPPFAFWILYHRLWHLYADSPWIMRILSLVVILKTLLSSVRGLLIKLRVIGFLNLNGRNSQVVRSPRVHATTETPWPLVRA
jgi:hypothetical protein